MTNFEYDKTHREGFDGGTAMLDFRLRGNDADVEPMAMCASLFDFAQRDGAYAVLPFTRESWRS